MVDVADNSTSEVQSFLGNAVPLGCIAAGMGACVSSSSLPLAGLGGVATAYAANYVMTNAQYENLNAIQVATQNAMPPMLKGASSSASTSGAPTYGAAALPSSRSNGV